ncbi:MAG: UTP--glucose-1-phosphate uridylyltransferase [Chlamydiales bacterium]|nr:UTP--glucose-1-phosphate uridylyltransferase [Chlamydiales bacterium]
MGIELDTQIECLTQLQQKLLSATTLQQRLAIINAEEAVKVFLSKAITVSQFLISATPEEQYVLKAITAIGQGPVVLKLPEESDEYFPQLKHLADLLWPTECFYDVLGGIVGYYLTILRLIRGEDLGPYADQDVKYYSPPEIDIRECTPEVRDSIIYAIQHFGEIGEVYVVGGAGDRLDLRDNLTGEPLPAARLRFQGRSLLEGLIRDLQAREYLHFKLQGKQLVTPVAMMTSDEKNNHHHILEICKKNNWFGRPQDSFKLFSQPGGPVVTVSGDWSLKSPLTLTMKPGGHGVLWKLAEDLGIFDWFESHKRRKLLVRQINNPVACTDYGVLSFLGFGLKGNKGFGMASCERLVNRPEGMSVLIETQQDDTLEYRISNIEYTEFDKRGIQDIPKDDSTECSCFPANTNILLADIAVVRQTIDKCPLPGLLINMKTTAPFLDSDWSLKEVPAGRLETTMQNIADCIIDNFPQPIPTDKHENLRTFATYYDRKKTLSTTKNSLKDKLQAVGTPEGCFYDVLCNHQELLEKYCKWTLPTLGNLNDFVQNPPSFLIQFHPALGPVFAIIAQKLRGGSMAKGSELRIEASEVDMENLHLDGSLNIICDHVLGHIDDSGQNVYSNRGGKCTLHNVTIQNRGVDYERSGPFWRQEIVRNESFHIVLHGNAEFHAENITFIGDQSIEVSDGERLVAKMADDGDIVFESHRISAPTWFWKYKVQNSEIILTKMNA